MRGRVAGHACHLVFPKFATARNAYVVITIMSTRCPLHHYGNGENPPISLLRNTALSKLEWLVPPPTCPPITAQVCVPFRDISESN